MYFIFFAVVIVICVFILFILSRQDFVLLRQNISLAQIFDSLVFALIIALVTGRIFYIINNFDFELVHIIRFFHLLKFPGISTLGFFLGGTVSLAFLFRKKKGLARIYDIFTISFLPVYSFALITKGYPNVFFFLPPILLLFLIFIFAFFIISHNKYFLRDGSVGIIFILILCLENFFLQFINLDRGNFFMSLSFSQLLSVPISGISLLLLFLNQKRVYKNK